MPPQEKEKLVAAITKALGYAENGGKPNLENLQAGKTGEMKSIFQFIPSTWKLYAKQIFGDENMPMNPDNEVAVVTAKVGKWLDEGRTVGQIASMWNAGESKPDAYKQNWKGVNKKYGVAYDTPAYAQKVIKYAQQFYEQKPEQPRQSSGTLPSLAQANSTPAVPQAPITYERKETSFTPPQPLI